MSFNFFDPDKIAALTAAGFACRSFNGQSGCQVTPCCGQGCCCFCKPAHGPGVAFDRPDGVSKRSHQAAIDAALGRQKGG